MKNEGRGVDLTTDFKRVYVSVTETTDETRLLIKSVEPTELYTDKNTLIYSEEKKHIDGYVNLHMHLHKPEADKLPKVKNVWMLEDTRKVKYIDSTIGYKRWGHYKPIRYNPETMNSNKYNLSRFFATTDPQCLRVKKSLLLREPLMFDIDYEIPREFVKAYAESKGELDYVMVQPFYSSLPPLEEGGERLTHTKYKKDIDGYIALFPAISYNKAMLESQLY